MGLLALGAAALALVTACEGAGSTSGQHAATVTAPAASTPAHTARLLFAGDVMLGRGVARLEPDEALAGIRPQVGAADVAVANLESPLTARPHDPTAGPNALEADPAAARLLATAGFDALAVANNHAGDAGPGTVTGTLAALAAAGLPGIGGGATAAEAIEPRVVQANGLRIALLAFDATGQGPAAGQGTEGVAAWDEAAAHAAVERARAGADVVVVGLHAGAEYVPTADPYTMRLAGLLASWGVDVVWAAGPHVVQPFAVLDPDGDGRPTVVAASLGNLLFDQHAPGTRQGALLEVVAGPDGIRAYRVGDTDHLDGPVRFAGWRPPPGDAVLLDDGWWSLTRPAQPLPRAAAPPDDFPGDVVDASLGDADGDGTDDLVVAFRRPSRARVGGELVPAEQRVDGSGRTAHVGVYRPDPLESRWVAGTLVDPVARVAACDGTIAVGYSTLVDDALVRTGAWRWGGFGFVTLPDLTGPGTPACADVDGDGASDPLVLERSTA